MPHLLCSSGSQVTCEALLQFLLAAIDPLTGGPAAQPLTALRLLLACAHAASEEAGLEVLGATLLEEVRRVGQTPGEGQRGGGCASPGACGGGDGVKGGASPETHPPASALLWPAGGHVT